MPIWLLQRASGLTGTHQRLHIFKLFLRQYAYCQEHDRFEAIPAVPAQLPGLLCKALDSLQAIQRGMSGNSLSTL